ncbi:hypothetical protein EU805_16040 [Salipiger sp. IMCC34102]|nr:hypothetical protein EU805_16040 [Salipiger sp. IMCC34102]
MLAGEYALDLLEGEDLRQAQELAARDGAFRAEVDHWQGSFANLFDTDPVTPPASVLRGVEAQIFSRTKRSWRDFLPDFESRGAVIAIVAVKVVLIAALVWVLALR